MYGQDEGYPESAMIALLPITTEWCKIKLPHMTLVYAGELSNLKPTDFNELAKDACELAMLSSPVQLRVKGVEVFGDEERVDVLTLEPTSQIMAMRHFVEGWNASQYKEFKPHCTVGPMGSAASVETPMALAFDRIYVGFGEQCLTFNLNRRY